MQVFYVHPLFINFTHLSIVGRTNSSLLTCQFPGTNYWHAVWDHIYPVIIYLHVSNNANRSNVTIDTTMAYSAFLLTNQRQIVLVEIFSKLHLKLTESSLCHFKLWHTRARSEMINTLTQLELNSISNSVMFVELVLDKPETN